MNPGEWMKVKIATHILQPLLNRRLPPLGPRRPLGAFRSAHVNEEKTRCLLEFENGRLAVSAPAPGVVRLIVSFAATRRTPYFNGEYFSYAVTTRDELPLAVEGDGARFTVKTEAPDAGNGGGSLTLAVDRNTGRLAASRPGAELFGEGRAASCGDWVSFSCVPPRSSFYLGLGQKTGGLVKNGKTYVMWNTDFADMGRNSDPLYQSCPFTVVLDGNGGAFGLFFDNPHYARFRLPRRGLPSPLSYDAARGPLVLYILSGPHPCDVVRRFTALTGRYRLPPLWALGHHHSRWEADESAARLESVAEGFRTRGIPLDALHIDIGAMRGFRSFTWESARFPDPDGFLRRLRGRGIHAVVITDPGLKKDEDWDVYREGKERGFFLTAPDGRIVHAPVWPGPAAFPDFGSPEAARWWGGLFRVHTEKGVDGFWIDMNEPAAFTPRRTLALSVVHTVDEAEAGGSLVKRDHASMHNYYGFLMAEATAEGLDRLRPGLRTFLFTRSSYAGIQRYASSWTGDNKSRWDHLRLSLPMVMNLGLSGQIMTGPDIGGFWGAPTPELFIRFCAAAAFYPFHRNHTAHGTPPQEIWAFGTEAEAICTSFIRLRYAMLLYLYTSLREGTITGDPLCRPLVYDYPDDPACLTPAVADTSYLCGRDLLIAPVLEKGRTERSVHFPTARTVPPDTPPVEWVSYWDHAVFGGGDDVTVPAPLDRLPLFVRKGAVLPVLLSAPGAFTSVDRLYEQTLCFDVYPAERIAGTLYLDDGETLSYRGGQYALVSVEGRKRDDRISVRIAQAEGALPASLDRFHGLFLRIARFGSGSPPRRVSLNGRDLPTDAWRVEGDWIIVSLRPENLPLEIELMGGVS